MNNLLRHFGLVVLAVSALLICCGKAEPLPETKPSRIPEPLKAWEGWVTWDDEHRDCPTPFNDPKKHLCFWPSRLTLQVDSAGGRFELGVSVFHEAWVPLPGGPDLWPSEVKVNGAPVPVIEHEGNPSVKLVAGTFRIEGAYQWSALPQRFPVPETIGIFSLTLEGKPVEFPARDEHGAVWLRENGREEQADRDFLSVKVHALLEDGIPLWLRSEVDLTVSGKNREVELGTLLPEGWKLASVDSPIPVAVDGSGLIKAQVRAGRWTIRADAFRLDTPTEFRYAPTAKPLVPEEFIAFIPRADFRTVEIVGPTPADASLTTVPEKWRQFPIYRWNTTTPFRIEERMRGSGMEKPPGLKITREWWLDENGRELTFRDRIAGEMQQVWRLDSVPGQDLGAVRSNGEGLLITRNPQNGQKGVEIRTRSIGLEATGRMERARQLPGSGWSSDADEARITLNLPPGWRLFAIFGTDWVSGDWLTAWTLLDLFLLLIFTLAVFRLWGVAPALIAIFAFGLSYHEPGFPRFVWLYLLVPLALLRVVPKGWAQRTFLSLKWIIVAIFVLVLVPFVFAQVQQAIYPQLEDARSYSSRSRAYLAAGGVPASAAPEEAPAKPLTADEIQTKLTNIVIPRIEFRDATIREVVAFLEQQSAALDWNEPDIRRRGVRINLKSDSTKPSMPGLQPSPVSPNEARITVDLSSVPLGEAIRYVAGLANLKSKVEPNGITLVPQATATEVLLTKEYAVSPGFIAETGKSAKSESNQGGTSTPAEQDARPFLISQGIAFPPGSFAIYVARSSKLIVRNTQENLDMIDATIEAAATAGLDDIFQKDPGARIQTGPGIPNWSWRTVAFGWNGPVLPSQQVYPVLISAGLERVISILRVLLILALAAVLLTDWKFRIPKFRRRSATIATVLLAVLGVFYTTPAHAQIPDQATLNKLRERLLQPSDAYPHAADIASVALKVSDRRVTIDAEIHVATQTAVPLPGRLPTWSPITVLVDDKPEAALRQDDGFLWVVLPQGIHRVRLEGVLANLNEWEWSFLLKPRKVTIEAPGWTIKGIRPDGVPEQQVFLSRDEKAAGIDQAYTRLNLQSVVSVRRRINLDFSWQVFTTVTRLSPRGKAIALQIPLLPGEKVVSSNVIVKDGFIEVRLGAQEESFSWDSSLPLSQNLTLATRAEDTWAEKWELVAAPIWNVVVSGLPPTFEPQSVILAPVWQPWPGEKVELTISRPEALSGATVTVDGASHVITLGKRQRTSKLEVALRCTVGRDFLIGVPADAEITSLTLANKSIPVRKDGNNVIVPLAPGEQSIALTWRINKTLGIHARTEEIRLPVESTNIRTSIEVPEDRWVLWVYGSLQGPAIRFWGVLVCSLVAAWALGRTAFSPLRPIEWMLLLIGLTQVPLPAALIVIAWLFFLAWRGRDSFQRLGTVTYTLLQILLMIVTVIALGTLIVSVGEGLLGAPEMFILGNDSTRTALHWYQARSNAVLPQPGCISVSIWWYRFLMLLWALWLALALIRWLQWGWQNFSKGGFFRGEPKDGAAPPPLPTKP